MAANAGTPTGPFARKSIESLQAQAASPGLGLTLGPLHLLLLGIGYIPATALVLGIAMILPVHIDISLQAASGRPLMAVFLAVYIAAGAAVYAGYGRRHSALGGKGWPT